MSTKSLADPGSVRPEEVERELVAALYPYTGGASFAALAQAPALAGRRRVELAEALARLVAGSVVTLRSAAGVARYELREAGRATLGQEPWLQGRLDELARGHAAWCEGFLAGAEEALTCGPGQKSWLGRIALEQANLSAAVGFALRSGDLALAARLALGMCTFWELRGPLEEARSLISCLLGAGPLALGTRASLLDGLGRVVLRQGDYERACRALRQALRAARTSPGVLTSARAGVHLGLAELCRGRPGVALGVLGPALAQLGQLDSPADLARGYATRALVALAQGHGADCLGDLDRAICLQVGAGDMAGWATSLLYRSLARLSAKCPGAPVGPDAAVEDARAAAQVFSDLGDHGGTAACLLAAASALSATRPAAALELAEMSERLRRESGALPVPALHQVAEAALARARRATRRSRAGRPVDRGPARGPLDALAQACGPSGPARPGGERAWALVQALGGFKVLRDGKVLHLPPQVARLVKVVVVGGGQVHVEQAVESLWPEVAPALGKRRLRNVLSKLSSATGPLVVREATTLRLGKGVEVDALRFESAARQALEAMSRGKGDGIAKALAAHRLYSGELLPEDRYEDFAIVARERLSWLHLRLLDAAAAAAGDAHDEVTAEHCLRAALEIDPTDEDRYVALARHLLSRGRRAAAGQVLETARALLSKLGFPVSPALVRAERALRSEAQGW